MQSFLENLLNEAGFTDQQQVDMLSEELEPLLIERLFTKILARVPEDEQDTFIESVEKWTPEDFDKLCRRYISNYEEVMKQSLDEFAKDYLASFEE